MPPLSRWVPRPVAPPPFLDQLPAGVDRLLGQLLWARDITDPDAIKQFLAADWSQLHDPLALRDMDRAVDRIRQARERGERVAVYGDFDTDGVTGVALLYQALSGIGLDVLPYIPKRLEEGYGLNVPAVEALAREVQLLITVDCGISNVKEIGRAQALGLDVIVLDHHTPPAVLPEGYAVINPKRPGCAYPYKMLAGVGVAYKLIQALHKVGMRGPFRGRDLLDVVALGTVTDMAPLDGENRVLVKYGLEAINRTERVGLRALIDAAAIKGALDSRSIGFSLGPRINAAGRLDDAILAYDLLLCDDPERARTLAHELNTLNTTRQAMTQHVMRAAQELALTSGKQHNQIMVLAGDGFPAGVVGLVAGKLVEHFGRPVLLLEKGEHESRGSARSVGGFSIIEALTEVGDLFEKFGGHSMAAGFSIRNDRLPALEERLLAIAKRDLTADILAPKLYYDAELALRQVSCDLIDRVAQLEPFGQGNSEPLWISRGVYVARTQTMGTEGQHLKLKVHDGRGVPVEAVAWRLGQRATEFRPGMQVDLAYTLEANEWKGERRVQLMVKDIRAHHTV